MRAKGHFGLWNMQERAASMNGDFSIDSEVGGGTTAKLKITGNKEREKSKKKREKRKGRSEQ